MQTTPALIAICAGKLHQSHSRDKMTAAIRMSSNNRKQRKKLHRQKKHASPARLKPLVTTANDYAIARAMEFHHASCNSVSGAENSPLAVFTVSLSPPTLPI
jgi:hypothetical protein